MLRSLTSPDGEAILPLALLKARLRITADDEDNDLERMRDEAIEFVEGESGQALSQRQFQWTDKQFCRAMNLPVRPLMSVDAIEYTDTSGATVALDEGAWYVGSGSVSPLAGTSWPYASGQDGAVRITFTAGYLNAEAEAKGLIDAVECAVAAKRDNRTSPDMSGAERCMARFRMPGLG